MAIKRGLGRGLDALIPTADYYGEGATQIALSAIRPNPRQPRVRFDPDELAELAESIRTHGILQPLVVARTENSAEFTLIAGQRRLKAAAIAELRTVPAVVRDFPSDAEMLELALIENLQRTNLNPVETATAYQALADDFGLAHDEIARRVGKQRTTVSNTLRLLRLPAPVQSALTDGKISEGHARALLALPTPEAQQSALGTVLSRGLNVRQTETLVRKLLGARPASTPVEERPRVEIDLEDRLRASLGTKVNLQRNRKGAGRVVIHFYSDEELDALTERLLHP
ncbi:MAG: ParB/RepB/Spo0J family partition protein [Anaerolineales bacterium]|jgi:ParB family chromosome partitioning protein|nr:stage 0 sporulation protein J [Anaerolineaceae bacterium]MDP7544488.1 ParB/RepB/Spo0J family partition protein [Anaerolineales bacterium]MDP7643988.1 ParB/RepB/Spo0J family partition protein [Anaerolineales bacterium]HJN40831.1 ParB/RepB/Spo0J family partition protein [Anaerolineales bacterium]|tara:strand:+ start:757 stop:1611 length:855 start_codon:yes stop_codon:yes gene_type:complete